MLGHDDTIAYVDFPIADASMLVEATIELPVQVNGKVRGRIVIAADATDSAVEAAALADPKVAAAMGGSTVKKLIVVPGRMVNIVI